MNIIKNTLSSINIFQAIGLSIATHLVFLSFLPSLSLTLPDELERKIKKIRLEIIDKPKPEKIIKKTILNKPVKKKIEIKKISATKPVSASKPVFLKGSKRTSIIPTLAKPVAVPFTPSNSRKPASKIKVSMKSNFALNRSKVTPKVIRSSQNNRVTSRTSYAKRVITASVYPNQSHQSIVARRKNTNSIYRNLNSGKALLIKTQTLHTALFVPAVRVVKNLGMPSVEEGGLEGDEFQEIWGQYTHSIQLKIANAKNYPALARERKQQGKAFLSFKLDREGKILELFIENSSGYEILDKAAIKAIEEAAPFPNIPKSLNKNYASLKIPISFILR
ncbi:MAG: TonB family protein [Nitrospina sp.]|jgi:TonB family protein|nr:TonB family protein [Nitrospina sp.]